MSRKPGMGFKPTVEALEDRFLLTSLPFRTNLTGFFSQASVTPGITLNLPTPAPFRSTLPNSPLQATAQTVLLNLPATALHPNAQVIRELQAAALTPTPAPATGHPTTTTANGLINYTPPIFSSGSSSPGPTSTTTSDGLINYTPPIFSSGQGLTGNLNIPNSQAAAPAAAQNTPFQFTADPSSVPNANPNASGVNGSPWFQFL